MVYTYPYVNGAGQDLTADDVLAFGRATIGGFQQPRRVELVPELPRNGSGKVLKHVLRDALSSGPDRTGVT